MPENSNQEEHVDNAQTITITDLRIGAREILEKAHFRNQRFIVERAGQPMVVIIGIEDFRRLAPAALPGPQAVPAPAGKRRS